MMDQAHAEAIRRRACHRKQSYSAGTARKVAAEACTPTKNIRPYRCPFCAQWHIGHVPAMREVRDLAAAVRWFATGYEGDPDA